MANARWKTCFAALAACALAAGPVAAPAVAQVTSVDPDKAIDADLAGKAVAAPASAPAAAVPVPAAQGAAPAVAAAAPDASVATVVAGNGTPEDASGTFRKDDLIGAAEGVFGKGAKGIAGLIEDILRKQGQPNGYIVGREGGGALVVGLRYGSGTLHHKVEGERPVYWAGPSIGPDAGANAGNAFVLVYNLFDTQDLYHRYGAGEGQAYFIGGFHVSYLRRKKVVLIPVRLGAGLRLGANVGYMKFSEKQRWMPF